MDDPQRDVDPTHISLAGAYNYTTGGDDNTLTDREIVHAYEAKWPGLASNAVANAQFLERVVGFLAERGIRQILDLGAGKPKPVAGGNVHEILGSHAGDARVVYVEKDPTAHSHARAMWGSGQRTGYVEADVRDVDQVLAAAETRRLIDFDEPVGILMLAVLHYVVGDAAGVVTRYADAVPAGSFLAVSHMASDGAPAELLADLEAVYAPAGGVAIRSRDEIAGMFCGWPLEDPGLVEVREWRPVAPMELGPHLLLGGVARKP
ncbi:SAM-dependent methyltransferase [Actinomadura rubrisoli]|uniref:SAM-dependent methyltransferase n=1 Tax=Actinomadura rubrisoli TaxID=2530368 RepID=A0A4R5CH85_9ACTN|nr:SAM-dependent methyltransferase [Actinomadura rubrisoli]TDD97663.1 SAM-dependent methyltransferase [Actinomadura rubrisoli]